MIFESIHIFGAFGLGFVLGMGLITALTLWFGCKHEYETIDIHKKRVELDQDEWFTKFIYVQQCKHCGKIKVTEVK